MKSRARITLIVNVVIIILSACTVTERAQNTPETRPGSKPPTIKGLIDLGNVNLEDGQSISLKGKDNKFSPGEWVLVQGKHLGSAKMSVNGEPVESQAYYFKNQPVFKVPTGLSPLKKHRLELKTEAGSASIEFSSSHYIVVNDLDGKEVHLVRTNIEDRGGISEKWLKLKDNFSRPIAHQISDDGRWLYVFDIDEVENTPRIEGEKSYNLDVLVYDLYAPNRPKKIKRQRLFLASPFSEVLLHKNKIILLGYASLQVYERQNAAAFFEAAWIELPVFKEGERRLYSDVIVTDIPAESGSNKKLVVLDSQSNTLVSLSLKNNQLEIESSLALLPEKSLPYSIDLVEDPKERNNFWVLQCPNYRYAGDALVSKYKRVFKNEKPVPGTLPVYQIQKIKIDSTGLVLEEVLPLPNRYIAYYAAPAHDGRLILGITKAEFFDQGFMEGDKKPRLKDVKRVSWDNIAFGRIIAVDLKSGEIETLEEGVGIYFHLLDVPDIGPVFSLLKLGPSLSPPFMTPNWGLGISSTGTYSKRKMNARFIFPPYSVGRVSYQD